MDMGRIPTGAVNTTLTRHDNEKKGEVHYDDWMTTKSVDISMEESNTSI